MKELFYALLFGILVTGPLYWLSQRTKRRRFRDERSEMWYWYFLELLFSP